MPSNADWVIVDLLIIFVDGWGYLCALMCRGHRMTLGVIPQAPSTFNLTGSLTGLELHQIDEANWPMSF